MTLRSSLNAPSRLLRRVAGMALVLGMVASTTACSRDVSLDFELLSLPQGAQDVNVGFEQIRLEEGFAIAVMARPLDDAEKMDWEKQVELEPTGFGSVMRVERMDWDEDSEERRDRDLRDGDWSFMMWGVSTGAANLEVYIDGEFEAEIPVVVSPQEE